MYTFCYAIGGLGITITTEISVAVLVLVVVVVVDHFLTISHLIAVLYELWSVASLI